MIRKIMPLLLLGLSLLGCGQHKQEIHDNAIQPSIAGVWSGSVKINGVSSSVKLTLQQTNVAVTGSYAADGASPVLANAGSLSGATTGPTFSLNMTGNSSACMTALQLGGENDGSTLSFNVIGTDCHGAQLRGESFLSKS